MDYLAFKERVKKIPYGKQLPDAVYVHQSALSSVPDDLNKHIIKTIVVLGLDTKKWNVIKFYKQDHKIALLHYPNFTKYSYPELHTSYTVDLAKQTFRKADYSKSDNPPILHRKESFVTPNHPNIETFIAITEEGEKIGLYENTKSIGFKKNWERIIKTKGYYLDDTGRLQALAEKPIELSTLANFNGEVERHKTAIDRNKLSQPMQAIARHNYLNGDYSVLDYGCGKGDDVRELEAHGINVIGWDPTHRPDEELSNRDIVNLGFVLNVIEDRQERTETLINAWKHAEKLLIVSVMVAGDSITSQFKPYKDGIITSRNTFQKYYSQAEIRYYIERTLEDSAIAVGQGIFLVFKDKIEEQIFLSERQHIKRDWSQKTQRLLTLKPKTINKDIIDKHIELFNDYWETTLELGRIPANSEFEFSEQIRRVCGSHIKAHHILIEHYGNTVFDEASEKRKEDLIVYFALSMFEKRKAQTKMPEGLKRDLKAFFPSYQKALEEARDILFSVGSPLIIDEACRSAREILGCGLLDENHSFTFHKDRLGDLPPELRIYIGCATQLYGDIDRFNLIKAHIRSGKVSLMRYDDWSKNEPLLLERVKIKLRDLDIDFFDYSGKYEPEPLMNKSIFDIIFIT